ncbi:hypothetical protein V6N13_124817 [Hibiscus sabdariffa]
MAQPAPTQQTPPANQSEGAGNTEQLNLSAEDIFDWHTPMEHQSQLKTADVPGSSKANDDTPAHAEPPTAAEDTLRRRRKAPAKRIIQSDRSSSPDQPEHQPAKRQRRYLIVTTDSDDEGSAGCKGALLGSYHIAEKRKTTPQGIHDPRIFPKPSGRTNKKNQSDPLEVPGNRLSETGSRRTLPPAGGFPARSDQPRQVKEAAVIRSCVDAARTKDPELTQAGNSSTCRSTHLGRRGKYNRECDKISIFFQQTLDQERTKSRPKTICRTNPKPKHTNVYKEVTAFSPRDTKYKQDKQLFGLRDKPITKQDALPRSEYQPRCLPGQDPLSLLRHPLCHPVLTDCRSPCIDEVEALTIDSNTTTV